MKSLNLTILLVLYYLSAIAQQYVPMPTGHVYWRYRSYFSEPAYNYRDYSDFLLLQTGDDTTINGMVYKKIMYRRADTSVPVASAFEPAPATVANKPTSSMPGYAKAT